MGNTQAHYESTGPEIWEQTEGKITHFVVGVGTGGTISGVGRYLKEKNPNIQIWGADTYGSVFKKYHETGIFDENEIYSYITEGIGEDILPKNVDFSVIDYFEKVTDKDGALRELAKKEGLFLGYSCGSAFQALRQIKHRLKPTDLVVVLFHDHGSRYVGKVYNDDWMRERGYLQQNNKVAKDLTDRHARLPLLSVGVGEPVANAISLMKKYGISQLPVRKDGDFVGSLNERKLFEELIENPDAPKKLIGEIMQKPFPMVEATTPIEEVARLMTNDNDAVIVALSDSTYHIVTPNDLVAQLG